MGYLQSIGARSGNVPTTREQILRFQRTMFNINDGSNPPYALLQETGVADAATRAAVRWFQQQTNLVRARANPPGMRLTEDGLFGPNTNAALEALAPRYGTRPIPNRVAVMDPVDVPVTPAPPAPRPATPAPSPNPTMTPAGTPGTEIVHGQAGGIQYQQPPAGMSTAKKVALVLLAGAVIGGVVYAAQSSSRSRRGSRG
jgi:hypothetical protein